MEAETKAISESEKGETPSLLFFCFFFLSLGNEGKYIGIRGLVIMAGFESAAVGEALAT